jgi:hypothetical protein
MAEQLLTPERIKQVIDYYRVHRRQLEDITDSLARKLGIDPEKDTVIVPRGMNGMLPDWMYCVGETKIEVRRGCRVRRKR